MTDKFPITLGNGCAVSDRFLLVAGFPDSLGDDYKFTRLLYLNLDNEELWQHSDWPDHTVTSLCLRKPEAGVLRAGCALSDEGYVEIANSSEVLVERIPGAGLRDVEARRETLGHVRGIKEIGATLFVCGYYGQLYQRGSGGWKAMAAELRQQGADAIRRMTGVAKENGPSSMSMLRRTANFNAVDGNSENDVYACGLSGHLHYWTDNTLKKIDTHTDAHLLDLHSVSADEILISGYSQTILSGNARDGFQLLHESPADIEFCSVRKFQGDIYVGTAQGLRRFNGSSFDVIRQRDVDFGESTVIQQIDSVGDNYLWIVGDRHAFRYDGRTVDKYEHPDNV